jgi:hypothetical protein
MSPHLGILLVGKNFKPIRNCGNRADQVVADTGDEKRTQIKFMHHVLTFVVAAGICPCIEGRISWQCISTKLTSQTSLKKRLSHPIHKEH